MRTATLIATAAVVTTAIWWAFSDTEGDRNEDRDSALVSESGAHKEGPSHVAEPKRLSTSPYEEPIGRWTLKFLDENRKTPIGGGSVYAVSAADQPVFDKDKVGESGEDGAALVEGPGRFVVVADGYCPRWCVIEPPAGTYEVLLSKSARIRGVVRDIAGEPIPGLNVSFSTASQRLTRASEDPSEVVSVAGHSGVTAADTTNVNGEFLVEGLPEGVRVFWHIDTIDYRIADFGGAEFPFVPGPKLGPLNITLFPIYVWVLWIDGWPSGNTKMSSHKQPLPPGVRPPVDSKHRATRSYTAKRDQDSTILRLARRAVAAAGKDTFATRAWNHGVVYGDGLSKCPSVIEAKDWEARFWVGDIRSRDRDRCVVKVPRVRLTAPSKLIAESVTIVDVSPHLGSIFPNHKRVTLRFTGGDGSATTEIPPFTIHETARNTVLVKKDWLRAPTGAVEVMLPATEVVVRCRLGQPWPRTLRHMFADAKFNVIDDGQTFELNVAEPATVVSLKVRDKRTGLLEKCFSYSTPYHHGEGSVEQGEALIVCHWTDELDVRLTRFAGKLQAIDRKLELRPGELNDVVVDWD